MRRIVSLGLALLVPVVALAAPGDLDSTFNGTGIVVTPVLTSDGSAAAVVVQSDGKIVAGGSAFNGNDFDFAIVRYDASGALDPAFGGGTGIVTTAVGAGDDEIHALIQQADGKLVAAGLSYDAGFNSSTITLVRYLDDGTPDPSFGGGDGKVTTAVSSSFDGALALIEQTDHKLVVAGYADTDIVVVRYGTDGTPDAMFGGGDGIVRTTLGTSASGNAIVQQASDGKLVVAGSADNVIAVVRYDSGGTLDTMFGGGDGIVFTTIGTQAEARGLVQQASDGKLVIAGLAFISGKSQLLIARYTSAGSPDGMFGTGGVTTTPIGGNADFANAVAEQGDGMFVVAGATLTASHANDVALVRYDTGGMPDNGFGTSGIVTTTLGDGDDVASAIAIQPNGGIVVAGQKGVGTSTQFAVARYLSVSGTTTSTTTVTTTSSTVVTTTSVTTTSAAPTTGVPTTGVPTTAAPTTTSVAATTSLPGTTIVTTTVPPSTTTTTLQTVLLGGGPLNSKGDCYLELKVTGDVPVKNHTTATCTDGDPCDAGPCGDDRCDFVVAACASQTDPALSCSPPPALEAVKLSGVLASSGGSLMSGPACSATTQVQTPVKFTKRGAYLANKSRVVIKGSAKAPKGVSPRKDKDKWTFQCMPRTAPCPE
jgi:uncharacterized delta-60 repeat protein